MRRLDMLMAYMYVDACVTNIAWHQIRDIFPVFSNARMPCVRVCVLMCETMMKYKRGRKTDASTQGHSCRCGPLLHRQRGVPGLFACPLLAQAEGPKEPLSSEVKHVQEGLTAGRLADAGAERKEVRTHRGHASDRRRPITGPAPFLGNRRQCQRASPLTVLCWVRACPHRPRLTHTVHFSSEGHLHHSAQSSWRPSHQIFMRLR